MTTLAKSEIEPYPFDRISPTFYTYTRKDGIQYEIHFERCHKLFTDACENCHRMWEVVWLPEGDDPCRDVRSGRTVVEIIKDFLKDDFKDAVLYKYYDDEKIHKRKILFDRLIRDYGEGHLEKICNGESVKSLADTICLVVKKDSVNYKTSIQDVRTRCSVCNRRSTSKSTSDFFKLFMPFSDLFELLKGIFYRKRKKE